jgi:hypothetical protein
VTLATFLLGLVGPMMARWLTAMGFTLITVTGLAVAYGTLKSQVISGIGGLAGQAIQLGGLMGIWEALGIILGAFVFVLTWRGTAGFWRLAKA